MLKNKIFFFLFFYPSFLLAKWNNNYSFFSGDGKDAGDAALNILSYILTAFGLFLFLFSFYKLLGSNSPEDKTRGAILYNVFLIILSVLFMANQVVLKKLLGVS